MSTFRFSRIFCDYLPIVLFLSAATLFSTCLSLAQTATAPMESKYTVSVQDLRMLGKGRVDFDKGSRLLDKGQVAQSIAHFEKAIAQYPEHYKAYYNLGVAHFRLSHLAEAEQAFQKAVDLSKGNFAPPQFGLGAILCLKANFLQAETLLQRALDLEPGSAFGKYYLGLAQFGMNRLEASERSVEQALLRNQAFSEAYLLLAKIHQRQHNLPAVQRDLEFYIKVEPRKDYAKNLAEQIERQTAQAATIVAVSQP